jgi:hypothetical protein
MKSLAILICGSTILAFNLRAAADERVTADNATSEIPLMEIWGFRIPGTHELRTTRDAEIVRQIQAIQRALPTAGTKTAGVPSGFAVLGTGKEALRAARAVIADGKQPSESFPAGSDISLVFFSYKFGSYVHLKKVIRRDHDITIEYVFVPHATKEMSEHFALIPLLNCPEGRIRVEVEQMPSDVLQIQNSELRHVDPEIFRKVVCKSFSFKYGKEDDKPVSNKTLEQ